MEKPKQENFPEQKDRASVLEEAAAKVSLEVNQLMEKVFKIEGFVQSDGRLDMQNYMARGSVGRHSHIRDMDYIKNRETKFSREGNFAKLTSAAQHPGQIGQQEMIEIWRQESRKNMGSQMELLAMILFHKFFSKDFMVVRSSTYDDYKNGIDMILVDRRTGAVICAFDSVIGYPASDRIEEKKETIEEIVGRDGATLKYGFRVKQEYGKPTLEEKELESLPIFCLQVAPDEFQALFDSLIIKKGENPSEVETAIVENILHQMESQCQKLLNTRPKPQVRENIHLTHNSIKKMQAIIKQL